MNFSLLDLKYNNFNKPYFDESFEFSISHSDKYVMCVLGIGTKVSVDIEEIKNLDFLEYTQGNYRYSP